MKAKIQVSDRSPTKQVTIATEVETDGNPINADDDNHQNLLPCLLERHLPVSETLKCQEKTCTLESRSYDAWREAKNT